MKAKIDFSKLKSFCEDEGVVEVIPVVVQDVLTREVLILAYVNEEALKYSLKNNLAAFWSTSRGQLWIKGLTSGNYLELAEVKVNCEQNSLLFLVRPVNNCGACHTKENSGECRKSCFYRKIVLENGGLIIKDNQ